MSSADQTVRKTLRTIAYERPLEWYCVRDRIPHTISDVAIADIAERTGFALLDVPSHVAERSAVNGMHPAVVPFSTWLGTRWVVYIGNHALGTFEPVSAQTWRVTVTTGAVVDCASFHDAVSFLLGTAAV